MTRRDIVIVGILILLSSGINPVNFFLSSTFLRSVFISSFYQSVSLSSSLPSRFLILLCLSIVPVLSYTALFLLPSPSTVISPFLFFHLATCAYPVIISSSLLLVFFYRSASLPRFYLLSTSSCAYFIVLSSSILLYLLPFLQLLQPFFYSLFSILCFLYSSLSSRILSHLLFTVHALVRS